MIKLSLFDSRLLKELANGLDITAYPYKALARRLCCQEQIVLEHLNKLSSLGIVRGINCMFDWNKLGFKNSLIAVKVDAKRSLKVIEFINSLSNVTHNYQRGGEFNLWFTFTYKSNAQKSKVLDKLRELKVERIADLATLEKIKLDTKALL